LGELKIVGKKRRGKKHFRDRESSSLEKGTPHGKAAAAKKMVSPLKHAAESAVESEGAQGEKTKGISKLA